MLWGGKVFSCVQGDGTQRGQLIAILTCGIEQRQDKASAKRNLYTGKEKEWSCVCVCVKERKRREKYTRRHGMKFCRDSFSGPPNHKTHTHTQTSSHTHRYRHKAIPFFSKMIWKEIKTERLISLQSPVAMVTRNFVTSSPHPLHLMVTSSNQRVGSVPSARTS